jgi:ABC-2 type transport system permease protein
MSSAPTAAPASTFASAAPAGRSGRAALAAYTLAVRELVRFVRQRHRVFGALGQPVLFWLLFGAGLGPSFALPGTGAGGLTYSEYFFPGTLVLILLFTAIFATISIIEDRREGFLQGVLVAPIPRGAMVLGKVLGGTTIALVEALIFLALGAAWLRLPAGPVGFAGAVVLLAVIGLALTSLGFLLAWRMDSTQGFHAVMNVFLMPMWLLSGAFFPAAGGWLGWIIWLNPLTYGLAALRRLLYWDEAPTVKAAVLPEGLPGLGLSVAMTVAFAATMLALACWTASRTTKGDLL